MDNKNSENSGKTPTQQDYNKDKQEMDARSIAWYKKNGKYPERIEKYNLVGIGETERVISDSDWNRDNGFNKFEKIELKKAIDLQNYYKPIFQKYGKNWDLFLKTLKQDT